MLTLRINDNHYPLTVGRADYMHGSEWTWTNCVRISDEVSDEIDHNHNEDFPGLVQETIHFALIDGWASEGTMREDHEELEPLCWAIEHNGQPIGRDALEELLNPGEVTINMLVGTNREGDPVEVKVERRRIGGHEAEQFVMDYANKHGLEINYLDRYGSVLVAQVE